MLGKIGALARQAVRDRQPIACLASGRLEAKDDSQRVIERVQFGRVQSASRWAESLRVDSSRLLHEHPSAGTADLDGGPERRSPGSRGCRCHQRRAQTQ